MIYTDNVAEWLRRLPAKQFPFGSVGSNPAVVVFYKKERRTKKWKTKEKEKFFTIIMEMRGIDPRAPRMQSECSTIWATPPTVQNKRKRETREINLEKKTKNSSTGIRTPVFHVTGEDTNQLYYWRFLKRRKSDTQETDGQKKKRKHGWQREKKK